MSSPKSTNKSKSNCDAAKMPPTKRTKIYSSLDKKLHDVLISLDLAAGLPAETLEALQKIIQERKKEDGLSIVEEAQKIQNPNAINQDTDSKLENSKTKKDNPEQERAWREYSHWQKQRKVDPTKFFQETEKEAGIWMQIMAFVGPGHFLYVALISKKFMQLYLASFRTEDGKRVHDLPMVIYYRPWRGGRDQCCVPREMEAIATNTFYSAAFSTISCAQYWRKPNDSKRSRYHPTVQFDPWDLKVINSKVINSRVCTLVAKHGNVQVLKWAQKEGFSWDSNTCLAAAQVGNLKALKYLHEQGCSWDSDTCAYAAKNGHLDCLKYAHEKRCDWDWMTSANAAGNGHLNCLKYAHEQGCQWDGRTFSAAAANGHLECLQYAHEEGSEWDLRTCAPDTRLSYQERETPTRGAEEVRAATNTSVESSNKKNRVSPSPAKQRHDSTPDPSVHSGHGAVGNPPSPTKKSKLSRELGDSPISLTATNDVGTNTVVPPTEKKTSPPSVSEPYWSNIHSPNAQTGRIVSAGNNASPLRQDGLQFNNNSLTEIPYGLARNNDEGCLNCALQLFRQLDGWLAHVSDQLTQKGNTLRKAENGENGIACVELVVSLWGALKAMHVPNNKNGAKLRQTLLTELQNNVKHAWRQRNLPCFLARIEDILSKTTLSLNGFLMTITITTKAKGTQSVRPPESRCLLSECIPKTKFDVLPPFLKVTVSEKDSKLVCPDPNILTLSDSEQEHTYKPIFLAWRARVGYYLCLVLRGNHWFSCDDDRVDEVCKEEGIQLFLDAQRIDIHVFLYQRVPVRKHIKALIPANTPERIARRQLACTP